MDSNSESPAPAATGNGAQIDRLRGAIDSTHNPQTNSAQVHELRYGTARAPLARVAPDKLYPAAMWRIVWPDGSTSDMANRDRCKDAAAAIVERGPPRLDRRQLHWQQKSRERAPEARTARQSDSAGVS
jgi:hypothetical protein